MAKLVTNASSATWWPKFESIQVAPSGNAFVKMCQKNLKHSYHFWVWGLRWARIRRLLLEIFHTFKNSYWTPFKVKTDCAIVKVELVPGKTLLDDKADKDGMMGFKNHKKPWNFISETQASPPVDLDSGSHDEGQSLGNNRVDQGPVIWSVASSIWEFWSTM